MNVSTLVYIFNRYAMGSTLNKVHKKQKRRPYTHIVINIQTKMSSTKKNELKSYCEKFISTQQKCQLKWNVNHKRQKSTHTWNAWLLIELHVSFVLMALVHAIHEIKEKHLFICGNTYTLIWNTWPLKID